MSYDTNPGHSSSFSIYDDQGAIGPISDPIVFYPGDLRYESISAQTGMSLENGAVVKRMLAEEGSAMLAEPRWFYDDQTNTAVIYLIGFNTTDMMSRTGIGTVKMELGQANYTEYGYDKIVTGDKIHITYTPNTNANYSTAWENYFRNTMKMEPTGSSGEFVLPTYHAPAKLVINRYEIIIKSL
jgi:hypothetical protein